MSVAVGAKRRACLTEESPARYARRRLGYLLRANLTAYGYEQDRRAQPSDDVNERRDFQAQHFGLRSAAQLPKDTSIDRRGLECQHLQHSQDQPLVRLH
jgi:hypothetical protein